MSPLVCFTDGSSRNNGKKDAVAGFAVYWPSHHELNMSSLLSTTEEQTNNRAETHAIIHAFNLASTIDPNHTIPLHIYTDSMLLVNSINTWMKSWKNKNWIKSDGKPVANKDLLIRLDQLLTSGRDYTVFHVRAHTKENTWEANCNRIVDQMAQNITSKC